MERIALVNKVKTKIDEISSDSTPLVDVGMSDDNPVDQIIESLLDESAVEILLKAPFYRLNISSAEVDPEQDVVDTTIGTFILPKDFLRLVYFKMSDWQKPVTELAMKGDEISNRQYNKHIRGGIARPVGVLSKDERGMLIEYYSTKEQLHSVTEFKYIKRESAEKIPNELVDALVWICAGKVMTVFGNEAAAKNAYDNAQSLMM